MKTEITIANEAPLGEDGWALIAPYGQFENQQFERTARGTVLKRYLQVNDEESIGAVLANEQTLMRRLKRATVGMPVYRRHPDHQARAPEVEKLGGADPNIKLGVIDKLRKSARGLEAHFIISRDMTAVVANEGFKYPSVLWDVCYDKDATADPIVCYPFRLSSVGLVQNPCMKGVESLANSALETIPVIHPTTPTTMLKDKITGFLIASGARLPENATEDQVFTALANGDYVGHEFHGNQYTGGEAHGSEHEASRKAHVASAKADDKEGHQKAAADHSRAAALHEKAGDTEAAEFHNKAAQYHASRAKRFSK